jgi:hypothetical protein
VIKKTVSYEDFNGEQVREDLFFHLSKPELVELELEFQPDGLAAAMQKMQDEEDGRAIFFTFKNIIVKSYGKRSADGKRFVKNDDIRQEFESSKAWETIFDEFITDPNTMNEFILGVIPLDLVSEAEAALKAAEPENPVEPTYMTMKEVRELSAEEYKHLSERIVSGEIVITDN